MRDSQLKIVDDRNYKKKVVLPNKKSGPKIKIYVKNPIESEVKFRSNLFLVTLLILLLLFKDEKYS